MHKKPVLAAVIILNQIVKATHFTVEQVVSNVNVGVISNSYACVFDCIVFDENVSCWEVNV